MSDNLFKKIQFRKRHPDVPTPSYKHVGDSGMDLAYFPEDSADPIILWVLPGDTILVPTGIYLEMQDLSIECQIRSRSGLSLKGITVANSPGTVDQSFSGQVMVILKNSSNTVFEVKPGDRIAQMVFMPILKVELIEVNEITAETTRGSNGFGSTGI